MGSFRKIALSLAATSLVLAGCSDDEPEDVGGEESSGPTDATDATDATDLADPAAAAAAAIRAFYDDLAAGELAAACDWWTADYVASSIQRWNEGKFGNQVETCPALLREITTIATASSPASEVFAVDEVTGELTGDDAAEVVVTLASGGGEPETYLTTLTVDGWRISGDVAGDVEPSETPSAS